MPNAETRPAPAARLSAPYTCPTAVALALYEAVALGNHTALRAARVPTVLS
jgi:hypothetical protein